MMKDEINLLKTIFFSPHLSISFESKYDSCSSLLPSKYYSLYYVIFF